MCSWSPTVSQHKQSRLSDSTFTLFDNIVAPIQILETLSVDIIIEIYVFRLTCAREHNGLLVERVYLKGATNMSPRALFFRTVLLCTILDRPNYYP